MALAGELPVHFPGDPEQQQPAGEDQADHLQQLGDDQSEADAEHQGCADPDQDHLPAPVGRQAGGERAGVRPAKSFAAAAWAVALADVSMSLDNVLAVAGAAREHPWVLAAGLVLSVALMGLAANLIARYIDRYRWIAWIGLAVILWVAGKMIYDGFVDHEVGVLHYIWPELAARLAH